MMQQLPYNAPLIVSADAPTNAVHAAIWADDNQPTPLSVFNLTKDRKF
jgi:hypothetical protein